MTRPAAILEKEIVRAIRAAKKQGLKLVRIQKGGFVIELPLDDTHIGSMSQGHLPAPDANEEQEKFNLRW